MYHSYSRSCHAYQNRWYLFRQPVNPYIRCPKPNHKRNDKDQDYENVNVKGARFVDFPSQAGAFFQWAVDLKGTTSGMTDYYRRAFNPSKSYLVSGFPWGYGEFPIMWDGDVSANIPAYKEQFEVCPPGYRRPTDGYTD